MSIYKTEVESQDNKIFASIIIPIYNSAGYIQQCLESVIKLRSYDVEIILIDDGSTDDSMKMCRSYAKKDSRIKLLSQRNRGVSCARNTGIKAASGVWITFIDSDDIIVPFTYDYAIKCLKTNFSAELLMMKMTVKMNIRHTSDESAPIHALCGRELDILSRGILDLDNKACKAFKDFCIISPVAKFYFRQILQKNNIIFNENVSIGEDRIFNYTYLQNIKKVTCINEYGYIYVQNSNSTMHAYKPNKGVQMLESLEAFRNMPDGPTFEIAQYGIRQYVSALKLDYCHPGNPNKYACRKKEALDLKKHPLVRDSFNQGKLFHLKPSVAVIAFFIKIDLFCACDFLLHIYHKKHSFKEHKNA